MADLPGIPEMSPDKGTSNKRHIGLGLPLCPVNGQMKTHLQIGLVEGSIWSGGAGPGGGSTLCPCDTAQAVDHLYLEGVRSPGLSPEERLRARRVNTEEEHMAAHLPLTLRNPHSKLSIP